MSSPGRFRVQNLTEWSFEADASMCPTDAAQRQWSHAVLQTKDDELHVSTHACMCYHRFRTFQTRGMLSEVSSF
eukprot:m.779256 g.779256  ORF g.779256 m.779256 type:complete len:74 (+) comp23278_c0_seq9:3582-3803(+)